MRSALLAPVSIVGLLSIWTLPFLLSAFVVFLGRPLWLLLICFSKAFCYAFVSLGFFLAFGTAGWLARILLLFSDWVCMPLLYWFWQRSLSGRRRPSRWDVAALLSVMLLVGSVDYRVIAPLLARLIES